MSTTAPLSRLTIAANQGEFGGGEVMLLAIAEAARDLAFDVTVVAPVDPGAVLTQARIRGFDAVGIPGSTPAAYLRNLRRWDARHRDGLLWCNGLRPALATAGHANRIVHLHQEPSGRLSVLARVARMNTRMTLAPSQFMAARIEGATPLENWTFPVRERERSLTPTPPYTVGYLGRLSRDKGVPVLCEAVKTLIGRGGADQAAPRR